MELSEVSKHFTGVALELRPTINFDKKDERERLKLSSLWQNMRGIKRAIIQTILLSIVLQAFVLASPYYMQIAIDRVLPAQDSDLLAVLAIGFGLFTAINIAAGLLRRFVLLHAGTSLGFGLSSNIARRLFRLPISWFEKRHVGDILSRFQSIGPIQNLLLTGGVAALIDGAMAALTLTVMFFYSATLALIALAAFAVYLLVRVVSFAFERDAVEATITTGAVQNSTLIETL
jgi:ATP-binding cassette subfamily B protein RaxB